MPTIRMMVDKGAPLTLFFSGRAMASDYLKIGIRPLIVRPPDIRAKK
jgi:hypothetical protein